MASISNTIVRTQEFPAYLSKASHQNLANLLQHLTELWNIGLSHRRTLWGNGRKERVGLYDQYGLLVARRKEDRSWRQADAIAQRSVLKRLDLAFQGFYRRCKAGKNPGYPRYRTVQRPVRSFEFYPNKIRTNGGKNHWLTLKGIGRIRFRGCPTGKIKLARLVRTARRVKLQFVVELLNESTPDPRPPVGIDVGITDRIALSDGTLIPGNKLDRRELSRKDRRLSRANKGSKNREKRRKELAREWQRVREREKGALHELTTDIVKNVSSNLAAEDLDIPDMVGNRRFSRQIMEQQWGSIKNMLAYKAESAGGELRLVGSRRTSQTCSGCGNVDRNARKKDRKRYRCASCGLSIDADVNAARNVRERAFGPLPGGHFPVGATREDQRLTLAVSV